MFTHMFCHFGHYLQKQVSHMNCLIGGLLRAAVARTLRQGDKREARVVQEGMGGIIVAKRWGRKVLGYLASENIWGQK